MQQVTHPPFIVLALPRSRTTWLSKFLSYGDWECGHDQIRYMRSLDDVKSWLSLPNTGTCETGATSFWRLLLKYRPDIRVVTIRRPVEEVVESLTKVGVADSPELRRSMARLDSKLDQIEGRLPNVKSVKFSDLATEQTCAEVFEFCLPYRHDHQWWEAFHAMNIQTNFPALMRYVHAHVAPIAKLMAQARQASFTDLSRKPVISSSVEISEGSFTDWVDGCAHLIDDHCRIIDATPYNWANGTLNLPVLGKLYESGFLQIMIARSNGKPFGYLVTLLSPSLESPGRKSAQHTAFYADKGFPWLGSKLQRAANLALRAKGFNEVFMRAGVRGDGARTSILFERLGAREYGKLYQVDLGD